MRIAQLHGVDDQARLLRPIDVKPHLGPVDHNLVAGPNARLQVDIRFVFLRRFPAQAVVVVIRVGAVLDRVIAADLIFGTPVRGTQIDVFVAVALQTDRDPDKAAGIRTGIGSRLSGERGLDGAVVKSFPL